MREETDELKAKRELLTGRKHPTPCPRCDGTLRFFGTTMEAHKFLTKEVVVPEHFCLECIICGEEVEDFSSTWDKHRLLEEDAWSPEQVEQYHNTAGGEIILYGDGSEPPCDCTKFKEFKALYDGHDERCIWSVRAKALEMNIDKGKQCT